MPSLVIAAATLSLLAPGAAGVSPGVDSGARIAAKCASCHAIGRTGASPNSSAPPFRDIRLRYNPISLERELGNISKRGHFEMKPLAISSSEAEDLAAYIESLGPGG